jgi:hypothetical protein
MELAFIWVERIRNLENLSLNFSQEKKFSFDYDHLRIEEEPNREIHIDKLYGESIINLTSIVGQNGVGKSTIFQLIRMITNDLKVTFLEENQKRGTSITSITYLAIFKIQNTYYYFVNKIGGQIECNYSKLNRRQKPFIDGFHSFYYANFFDYSSNYFGSHTIDVSTTALVNDSYAEIRDRTIENEEHIYEADFLHLFKTNEILSQIQFVADFHKLIPFDLPTRFAINIAMNDHHTENDFSDEEETTSSDDSKYYKTLAILDKLRMKYRGEVEADSSEADLKKYIKTRIQQAALINFLQHHVLRPTNVVGHYEVNFDINEYYSLRKISAAKDLDRLFIDLIDMIPIGESYSGSAVLKWIKGLIDLIEVKKHFDVKENSIYINLEEIDYAKLIKSLSSLSSFKFYPAFLNFYWEGISSGENALLTIFSRFYRFRELADDPNSSFLMIFDECEINFHPAWQRRLIYFLTTIFPSIFPSTEIQFFLSSHSPLILSDIPKSNVIFLEKGKDAQVYISHLSDKKQTFAANIHTLLSDTFFMEEGTIGEVAKNRINWLIDLLGRRYTEFEQVLTNVEELIEIIGEPVIKSKLTSLINEKHSLNLYNINARIKTLESGRRR